jgi:hypothetical protein
MSILQNKKDELTKELIAIKDAIDGIYKQELYEDEYNLIESKYIIKEPMIHLDVDKILEDLKNGCCEIKNIGEDNLEFNCKTTYITDHSRCSNCYYNFYNGNLNRCVNPSFKGNVEIIKLNFPIECKIYDGEYIIRVFLVNNNITNNICIQNYRQMPKSLSIIYITNYGRIIKSHEIQLIPSIFTYSPSANYDNGGQDQSKLEYIHISGKIIYKNNKTIIENGASGLCQYNHPGFGYGNHSCGYNEVMTIIIGGDQNKINLIEQPKLLYRMPKLFIDVIDAFHTQNTDLMQECCKKYLEISRESKVKESIMLDIKIKNISDEKDKIIEQKDKIIQDKDTEIESIKKQLEELQQKYDKIKSMFD